MTDNAEKKAVLYTDGGCHQKVNVGGWGIHGYTYTDEEQKRGYGVGSFRPSAIGYVPNSDTKQPKITVLKYIDCNGTMVNDATNNTAELMAFIKACELVLDNKITHVHFNLDSQYVLKGVNEWLPKWVASEWRRSDGTEVKNINEWKRVIELLERLKHAEVVTSYAWVKGHSGDPGNNSADESAEKGLIVGMKKINHIHTKFSDPEGYWNKKPEFNRLFAAQLLIFYSGEGEVTANKYGMYPYRLFSPPSGWEFEFFGTREADCTFSIIYLKEPDKAIDVVKRVQKKIDNTQLNGVVAARIDHLFKPKILNEILENEDLYLYTLKRKSDLFTLKNTPLTKELRPPRMAYIGIEAMMRLETILMKFLDEGDSGSLELTDLSSIIYEEKKSAKKTELKVRPEFDQSTKHVDVDLNCNLTGKVEKHRTRLIFGIDLPPRNVLAAVAKLSPKLTTVTWRQANTVYHLATILQTDDGVGIWSNMYSNFRFVHG
jgi:ribonuclease HI